MASPPDDALAEFVAVMRRLRAECPWKQQQTHRSLARYLLEETHETLEAIDTGDVEHLREELGDLLLQVVFHAVIAEQAGEFDLDDVARDITAKMRRRNPHVYGPPHDSAGAPPDAASVTEVWEAIKATEKHRDRVTDGLPPGLPALLYADKVLDRLERAGQSVEQRPTDDLGDRLLALVAESRQRGVDPEQALRDAVRRLL
ncbi:MazG family protein [Nocardioides bizhenqiangii]|uniref:MazG family protein n=1 Tax=Nocardioides bizhenqiangii TaxID=3095076 RepID=A0ABZ0ZWX4_9ACTN|nr:MULTISPECIES: MazG family protein [unclassified Nocardioides]MDZ5623321.1 MazG family protein [Nocardioides sp. HM23]WQQ28743.1 MazG family protein [Nocardioides sp. HM61]